MYLISRTFWGLNSVISLGTTFPGEALEVVSGISFKITPERPFRLFSNKGGKADSIGKGGSANIKVFSLIKIFPIYKIPPLHNQYPNFNKRELPRL